jgi:type VI secretion system protein VasG
MVADIAKLQLGRIEKRIKQNYDIPFSYDDDVIKLIVDRCNELESGGRMIDAILTNTMLPAISQEFLTKMMEGEKIEGVRVDVIDGEFSYGFGRS